MDRDGMNSGYDLAQLSAARERLSIPLVASGGARTVDHFEQVFRQARVNAALAAGAFHRGELLIPQLKSDLAARGIEVRP
jgi:cyclase